MPVRRSRQAGMRDLAGTGVNGFNSPVAGEKLSDYPKNAR